MIEFAVFFIIPFDETMPYKETESALEHAKQICHESEARCIDAYHALVGEDEKRSRRVWAQSRIDYESRVIGVGLRMPIEKGAEQNLVPAVIHDDFLYWDLDVLVKRMQAMRDAVNKEAQKRNAKVHTAFSDVKYRY